MICRRSPRALPSRRSRFDLGSISVGPSGISNFLQVFDTFGEQKPSKPWRRANFKVLPLILGSILHPRNRQFSFGARFREVVCSSTVFRHFFTQNTIRIWIPRCLILAFGRYQNEHPQIADPIRVWRVFFVVFLTIPKHTERRKSTPQPP